MESTADSVSTPFRASSWSFSSYASPFDSAEAKIVGLVVTPTTRWLRDSSARLPVLSRSRDRSSSQMATPASERVSSGVVARSVCVLVTVVLLCAWWSWAGRSELVAGLARGGGRRRRRRRRVAGDCGDRLTRGQHDGPGREAELLVERLVGGRGAVVLERHGAPGVTDDAVPRHRDAGLDRHPGADGGGEDLLAVLLVLLGEPLLARHRHDAGRDAVVLEHLARLDGELHLGPRADEDHLRLTV